MSSPSNQKNLEQILLDQLSALNLSKSQTIYVALSGGLDSAALLFALHQLKIKKCISNSMAAIHVHHGLSNNADNWLTFCQQSCEQKNIQFIAERVHLDEINSNGLEEAARLARYDVFENHVKSGDVLLMAHHANDQVETFMMRLMRGSGLTGLTAMEQVRSLDQNSGISSELDLGKALLVRPWLDVSRNELEAYAKENKIECVQDESNFQNEFDRNWWRNHALPEIEKRYAQSQASILKTVQVLKQEQQLLLDLLQPILNEAKKTSDFFQQDYLDLAYLEFQAPAVQLQVLRLWLSQLNIHPMLNDQQLKQAWNDVVLAQADAQSIFAWQGHELRRFNQGLYVLPALIKDDGLEKLQSAFIGQSYQPQACVNLPFVRLIMEQKNMEGTVGLKPDSYELAFYQGSIKAKPVGRSSKALKKWMQELAVPPWYRRYWPLLLKDGQLACVPGLFVCEGFLATQGQKPAWQLSCEMDFNPICEQKTHN